VKLDATYVKRIADATGFDTAQLEKLIRLRQLWRIQLDGYAFTGIMELRVSFGLGAGFPPGALRLPE